MVFLGLLTRSRSESASRPEDRRRTRPVGETLFDCLLGLSIASWAVAGVWAAPTPAPPVRWAIAALHLTVAFYLVRRSGVRKRSRWPAIAVCVPALVIAGLALKLGAPLDRWPFAPQAIFVAGTALTVVAFGALGSSFAFFPALRRVAVEGPYRFVRHPAYAGELLMVTGALLSRPTALALAVLGIALPLVGLRIRAEESLLLQTEDYRNYADRVPSRLVPGIW